MRHVFPKARLSQLRSRPWAFAVSVLLIFTSTAAAQVRVRDEFRFPNPYLANSTGSGGFIETSNSDFIGWVSDSGGGGCNAVALVNRASRAMNVLHVLDQQSEGCDPQPLVEGHDGSFYGVTNIGGPFGFGTVFKVSIDGAFNVIHAFTGGANGGRPAGPLMLAGNGILYGTTAGGAAIGSGSCCSGPASSTVFTVSTSGTVTTIANLSNVIGGFPEAPVSATGRLFQAKDARIYGTTQSGPALNGSVPRGTIYRIELNSSITLIHLFAAPDQPDVDGIRPNAGVIQATDGYFYGTTSRGGAHGNGTVFRLTPGGTPTTLWSFDGETATSLPLVDGGNGHPFIYGSSSRRHFFIASNGEFTALSEIGSAPLLKSRDGRMWGMDRGGLFSFSNGPLFAGAVDDPQPNQIVDGPFVVSGWAIDHSAMNHRQLRRRVGTPDDGRLPIDLGGTGYGIPRPDVGQIFGSDFTNSGFGLAVNVLTPGRYQLIAYPFSSLWGTFDFEAESRPVTVRSVAASAPRINIDGLTHHQVLPSFFELRGWAVDLASRFSAGINAVHLYAYPNWDLSSTPIFLGAAPYGITRPDVAAKLGYFFTQSGFRANVSLARGRYTIVAFARSAVTGLFSSEAREITVGGDPRMALEAPADLTTISQPFVVGGWAIDRDAPSGSGVDAVHVWAFPSRGGVARFLGAATYGGDRYDVSAALDPVRTAICDANPSVDRHVACPFEYSGFGLIADSLPPGTYDIVAYAHSSVTGEFSAQRRTKVTVQ